MAVDIDEERFRHSRDRLLPMLLAPYVTA